MNNSKNIVIKSGYCEKKKINCLCKGCVENKEYYKNGNCTGGCSRCGQKGLSCLITGTMSTS